MNLLIFVFSLLLIFSYSFFISFEKFNGERRIRSTYLGHLNANRKILSAYENELYKSLPEKPKAAQEIKLQDPKQDSNKIRPAPLVNPECSRLNIEPLIATGIEENRMLYDVTAKLIKNFYGEALLEGKPRAEYKFLDALLKIAKKNRDLPLEKFDFKNKEMQEIYYQMLKGTKKSYPSLLDYIVIRADEKDSHICLYHAHPHLIATLFGPKASQKIYDEMHKPKALPITQQVIERLCSEVHTPILQPEIFTLLNLGKPSHKKSGKKALIRTDGDTAITLRKDLYLKNSS